MKCSGRALVLLMACFAISAFGWGDDGHETIGAMADQLLAGTSAGARVHALLGQETLATAAIWADQIKYRTNQRPEAVQFRAANPNHAAMHYTDIPFQEAKYRDDSIGARPDDVVHAISACILILRGKPEKQSVFTGVNQKIALRLLAHYVGDIHQPLHVGSGYLDGLQFIDPNGYGKSYGSDVGANQLVFSTNKLHFYWDITVVQQAMLQAGVHTPEQYAARLLARNTPPPRDVSPLLDWPRDWANESLALSAKARAVTILHEEHSIDIHSGKPRRRWRIGDLSPDYLAWSVAAAQTQISHAGWRLAQTLEAIWP